MKSIIKLDTIGKCSSLIIISFVLIKKLIISALSASLSFGKNKFNKEMTSTISNSSSLGNKDLSTNSSKAFLKVI